MKRRMMYTTTLLLIGAFLPLMHAAEHGDVRKDSLEQFLAIASSEDVARVDIFYMPESAITEVPVTPEVLEHGGDFVFVVRHFQQARFREGLLQVLKQSSMVIDKDVSQDMRWGVVFYDLKGKRVLSVFLGRGNTGAVNSLRVRTDGKFAAYLRKEFEWITKIY